MKRAGLALVLACVGAGVLAGCTKATIQPGDARLSFDRARVQVAAAGKPFRSVAGGTRLRSGDRVKVVSGDAELSLARGARMLLRKGTEVVVQRQPTLVTGDAVAETTKEDVTVRSAGSAVTVEHGAARVHSGLVLTAGVYSGSARVDSAGRSLRVPAYRQASVVAFGVVPATPVPLEYSESDPWDMHYLDVAVEIGQELQKKSDAFSLSLRPTEGHTPGFYTTLLPGLPSGAFDRCGAALDGGRRPGEALAGLTVALQARGEPFEWRCRQAFTFRDEGATWGLVAVDQSVRDLKALRDQFELARGRLPAAATFAQAPTGSSPTPDAGGPVVTMPTTPAPRSSPPANGSTTPPSGATPPVTPPPTTPAPLPGAPPGAPLPQPPGGGLLTPVTDLVDGLLKGLIG
jgi:hypothetical protein